MQGTSAIHGHDFQGSHTCMEPSIFQFIPATLLGFRKQPASANGRGMKPPPRSLRWRVSKLMFAHARKRPFPLPSGASLRHTGI